MSVDPTADALPRVRAPGRSATLSPVASMSRREAVVREIRRGIVIGALSPGDRLTENALAASLSVSRPTMREALGQLAQEGLLVQEPYRGLRVADVSAREIMDIARTRVALDLLAIQDVWRDETGERLRLVEQAWHDYDALPFDADLMEAHEAHIAFHRRLWEASENTFLLRLWPATEAHLTIALARDQQTRHDPRRSHEVHEKLVDAIKTRTLPKVEEALRIHTVESARELVGLMKEPSTETGRA